MRERHYLMTCYSKFLNMFNFNKNDLWDTNRGVTFEDGRMNKLFEGYKEWFNKSKEKDVKTPIWCRKYPAAVAAFHSPLSMLHPRVELPQFKQRDSDLSIYRIINVSIICDLCFLVDKMLR
jgi:hypothetical protein